MSKETRSYLFTADKETLDAIEKVFDELIKPVKEKNPEWADQYSNSIKRIPPITGEDVAALLHRIQERYPNDPEILDSMAGKPIYFQEDLLPVLEALGLPAPVWRKSMTVEEWKKQRNKS